jgi:hypothetical protein
VILGETLRTVVADRALVDAPTLGRLLAPEALTGPRARDAAVARRIQASPAFRAFRAATAPAAPKKRPRPEPARVHTSA